jgi:DNA topoisomerase VI subunit B
MAADDLFLATPKININSRRRRPAPTLQRIPFRKSVLLEFCGEKELVNQTGHAKEDWPLVVLKECLDNAIDASEEAKIAPEIDITFSTSEITIRDNGPGIPPDVIEGILDYTARISTREAYVSPTRGQQGNALKSIIAMAFALDGKQGETIIESRGIKHRISFSVDQLRQEPRIRHDTESGTTEGTVLRVLWPDLACSIVEDAKPRFVQIADDFTWLNPHLTLRLYDDDALVFERTPSQPDWKKWRACDPTSAHWYDRSRLERYIAAHIVHDQEIGQQQLVREFIAAEFDGFKRTSTQKAVLDQTGLHRTQLAALVDEDGAPRQELIGRLLTACKEHSNPVKPRALGIIGRNHLLACFRKAGVHENSFYYKKAEGEHAGFPWVVESAFGYCLEGVDERRIVAGVNFSVGIGNPFRSFRRYGGEGLEAQLNELYAGANQPIVYVLHCTHPRVEHTDRGKTAVILPGRDY